MKRAIIKKFYDFEYLTIIGIPMRATSHGDVMDLNIGELEMLVAREIIKMRIPIRGLEFNFLRKVLGLSLSKMGEALDISAPALLKWERAPRKRLVPINEVAVRAFMAEQFYVKLSGKFTALLGLENTPADVTLDVKKLAA